MECHNPASVIEADKTADDAWGAYVFNHPDGDLFHHPAWYRALEKENGQTVIRLMCRDQQEAICGVFPLIKTNGMPFGLGGNLAAPRLSSLPRTPLCGPLSDNPAVTTLLIQKAMDIAQKNKNIRLQIKSMQPDLCASIPEVHPHHWRNSYIKFLPDKSDTLRFGNARNNARIQCSINKANSSGAVIRTATDKAELAVWHRLYVKTMQRHMIPARSFVFFSELWDNCFSHGYIKLILVDFSKDGRNRTIAGSLFLLFKEWSYYAFNGGDPEYFSLGPNDLIQWHFLRFAHENAIRLLDLGEVEEENEGLKLFKKKWGSEIKPIYHFYFPSISEPQEKGKTAYFKQLALPIWKYLPLAVTSAIGKQVNKYL
jgi:hypothetical protein